MERKIKSWKGKRKMWKERESEKRKEQGMKRKGKEKEKIIIWRKEKSEEERKKEEERDSGRQKERREIYWERNKETRMPPAGSGMYVTCSLWEQIHSSHFLPSERTARN
jgi:hypothetical protein